MYRLATTRGRGEPIAAPSTTCSNNSSGSGMHSFVRWQISDMLERSSRYYVWTVTKFRQEGVYRKG